MEATWTKYREAICSGAYGLYKGGAAVNIESGYCELMMLRSHMRELNRVYGEYHKSLAIVLQTRECGKRSLLPGIEDRDFDAAKVFHVAGHK